MAHRDLFDYHIAPYKSINQSINQSGIFKLQGPLNTKYSYLLTYLLTYLLGAPTRALGEGIRQGDIGKGRNGERVGEGKRRGSGGRRPGEG